MADVTSNFAAAAPASVVQTSGHASYEIDRKKGRRFEVVTPFLIGGVKGTGVGPREQGSNAVEFLTEVKTVYVDYTGGARKAGFY